MNSKQICCIGAGYVGGPTMSVIALKCPEYNITVVDSNDKRINSWNGPLDSLPIFEPGLKEVINSVRNKNLFFSTDVESAIRKSDIIFIAVNTPTKTSGEGKGMAADLSNIKRCSELIAKISKTDKIIVEKSTAPVGTAQEIKDVLKSFNTKNKFEIISNPEFLAEGTAINDLTNPDRVLIGGENTSDGKIAINKIADIYKSWVPEEKIIMTNTWSSELSKLASNSFLAQRISSINSLSALCEKTGAKIDEVAEAVGMDSRIGSKFLKASVGFGGSCFKKDILNLVYLCKHFKLFEVAEYWENVLKINDFQKKRFSHKIINTLKKIKENPTISVLGWAFKKDTNDSRESASIEVVKDLLSSGINVNVYDPMVPKTKILNDIKDLSDSKLEKLKISSSIDDSLVGSHGICITTEWDQFKEIDFNKASKILVEPVLFIDGRNIIDQRQVKSLFEYIMYIDS